MINLNSKNALFMYCNIHFASEFHAAGFLVVCNPITTQQFL